MTAQGVSERRALALVHMSASSLRYTPAPDTNAALRARIVTLAHRHRRYGAGMIFKLRRGGRFPRLGCRYVGGDARRSRWRTAIFAPRRRTGLVCRLRLRPHGRGTGGEVPDRTEAVAIVPARAFGGLPVRPSRVSINVEPVSQSATAAYLAHRSGRAMLNIHVASSGRRHPIANGRCAITSSASSKLGLTPAQYP